MAESANSRQITAGRWQKLKAILADALEETSSSRRAELLRQACANDVELLRDAEALLSGDTASLEQFAEWAQMHLREDLPERVGEQLGAYRIIKEIGRGGMGAVYLAERADGQFEREVALKVLKRGTDTEEVLRRFRAERQILAKLDHPCITQLFDAGVTSDDLPYFVMELVSGQPITRFANGENASLRSRLELFLKVCSAVRAAHEKGIIHRDIKPSNVLIKPDGQPKLLDFGIAKVIAASESDDVTVVEERRLTPKYAAPELHRGEPVTAATDVYSLGTLLRDLVESCNSATARDHSSSCSIQKRHVIGIHLAAFGQCEYLRHECTAASSWPLESHKRTRQELAHAIEQKCGPQIEHPPAVRAGLALKLRRGEELRDTFRFPSITN